MTSVYGAGILSKMATRRVVQLSHAQRLCGDKMRVKEEISIRRTGNPMSEGGEVLRRSGHSVNNVEAGIKGPTSEFECVRRSAHHQARSPR